MRHFIEAINKKNIKEIYYLFKRYGLEILGQIFWKKVKDNFPICIGGDWYENKYYAWIKKNEPNSKEIELQKKMKFLKSPKISIVVPAFNTPKFFLIEMIKSVFNQTYSNWELCIADGGSKKPYIRDLLEKYSKNDARIKIIFLNINKGISGNLNEALALSTGEYVTFLDHDDTLSSCALYEIVKAINKNPKVDFIYSDEDKIREDGKKRFDPHFKPDWSPDTLKSYNYICHLAIIRKKLLENIGSFRKDCEGSQDYDIILRATEKSKIIIHIPKILYHWRTHKNSTARAPKIKMYAYESAIKALRDYLKRVKLDGSVRHGQFLGSYQIKYKNLVRPKISIIICNICKETNLSRAINSVLNRTDYRNLEIIIVKNENIDDKFYDQYYKLAKEIDIKIIRCNRSFNYPKMKNYAIKNASGKILLFLDNVTENINSDWIERMLEHILRKDVGAVGAKLYFEDNTIKHAGIILGINDVVGYSHKFFPRESSGYFGRLKVIQNVSAVTCHCLMTRKEVFKEIGGFDESYYVALYDVHYCLKLKEKGYLTVWTPYSELYYFDKEKSSFRKNKEKRDKYKKDISIFCEKWRDVLYQGDPYYNKNLSLDKADFSLKI